MKFLVPTGGFYDERFGILSSPAHTGIPKGIVQGMPWAAENEMYTRGSFDRDRFFGWLETMQPYKEKCLFVPVPDNVGNAIQTLAYFRYWIADFSDWPVAFIAQDGQEDLDFPDPSTWGTLFIGGTTDWKESLAVISIIKRAQALGKHIHIGRVNWGRRYRLFRQIRGSEHFTADGTRTRYDGVEKATAAWAGYQDGEGTMVLPIW